MNTEKIAVPTVIVIFGGTSDLAKRKQVPAFYNLFLDKYMPTHFAVLGIGRTIFSDDEYRMHLETSLGEFSRRGEPKVDQWEQFKPSIFFLSANLAEEETFQKRAAPSQSCKESAINDFGSCP